MLCYTMLYYTMLCYAMLCYLSYTIDKMRRCSSKARLGLPRTTTNYYLLPTTYYLPKGRLDTRPLRMQVRPVAMPVPAATLFRS
jgi:hypothetical protein